MMSANEMKPENNKEKKPAEVVSTGFEDLREIDAFDTWRTRESAAEKTESQDIVYSGLPINVQRFETVGRDGSVYNSYGVAFSTMVRGKELVQKMYVVPPHSDRMIYQTLAVIFGDKDMCPLEIVKTETFRNEKRTINYTMRVSCTDDYGSDIICTLTTSGRGDRVIFQNLLEILKKRGLIG